MKTISGNCRNFRCDRADGRAPVSSALDYRVITEAFEQRCQLRVNVYLMVSMQPTIFAPVVEQRFGCRAGASQISAC